MMKNKAKIIFTTFIALLFFAATSLAIASGDVSSLKRERDEVKTKLQTASGSSKERLMKRLAKLENQITESSSADRKQSK